MVEVNSCVVEGLSCECRHFLTAHGSGGCKGQRWEDGVGVIPCPCDMTFSKNYRIDVVGSRVWYYG